MERASTPLREDVVKKPVKPVRQLSAANKKKKEPVLAKSVPSVAPESEAVKEDVLNTHQSSTSKYYNEQYTYQKLRSLKWFGGQNSFLLSDA